MTGGSPAQWIEQLRRVLGLMQRTINAERTLMDQRNSDEVDEQERLEIDRQLDILNLAFEKLRGAYDEAGKGYEKSRYEEDMALWQFRLQQAEKVKPVTDELMSLKVEFAKAQNTVKEAVKNSDYATLNQRLAPDLFQKAERLLAASVEHQKVVEFERQFSELSTSDRLSKALLCPGYSKSVRTEIKKLKVSYESVSTSYQKKDLDSALAGMKDLTECVDTVFKLAEEYDREYELLKEGRRQLSSAYNRLADVPDISPEVVRLRTAMLDESDQANRHKSENLEASQNHLKNLKKIIDELEHHEDIQSFEKFTSSMGLLQSNLQKALKVKAGKGPLAMLFDSVVKANEAVHRKASSCDYAGALGLLAGLENDVETLLKHPEYLALEKLRPVATEAIKAANACQPFYTDRGSLKALTEAVRNARTEFETAYRDGQFTVALGKADELAKTTEAFQTMKNDLDQTLASILFDRDKVLGDADIALQAPAGLLGGRDATLNELMKQLDDHVAAYEYVQASMVLKKLRLIVDEILKLTDVEEFLRLQSERQKIEADVVKARSITDKKLSSLLGTMDRQQHEYDEAIRLGKLDVAKQRLEELTETTANVLKDPAAEKFFKFKKIWEQLNDRYKNAITNTPVTQQVSQALDEVRLGHKAVTLALQNGDYEEAAKGLTPLHNAIKKHDDLVNQHDAIAGPKAEGAKLRVQELKSKGLLHLQTNEDKISLLKDLRGCSKSMTDEQREAQREIYLSLSLDKKLLEHDKKKREEITETIFKNSELASDLQKAKEEWQSWDAPKKKALLKKVLNVQARALYGEDGPELDEFDEGPTSAGVKQGGFKLSSGKIRINVNPAAPFQRDFQTTLGTLLHENTHKFQFVLLDKLKKGELTEDDPLYAEALLFEVNTEGQGYVNGAEDYQTYVKQPTEEHAHSNGPKSVRAIIKRLK